MNVTLQTAAGKPGRGADEMVRWMDRVLGPDIHRFGHGGMWTPAINLYEDPAGYYLVADLAGVDPQSIDLRVEHQQLVFRGQRPPPRPPEGDQPCPRSGGPVRVYLMEIDSGPFQRKLDLPETVDADAVEAVYRNGFLWVKMPKKPRGGA